jgi:acetyltransferase-like isoleucine patch superfamily enzyme
MRKLKSFWWKVRDELKVFALWFVTRVPGRVGNRLRQRVMRRSLQQLGRNTVFQFGVQVTRPDQVSIGSNCNLGINSLITGGGGVRIGDWVGFGPDVKVWSMNHRFEDPDTPWLLQGWEAKPVVIEDDVWLAANVFVMPGVTIGKGAIVAAAAVVAKSIPPYAIAAGNPCRIIGWRKRPAAMAAAGPASAAPRRESVDEVDTRAHSQASAPWR